MGFQFSDEKRLPRQEVKVSWDWGRPYKTKFLAYLNRIFWNTMALSVITRIGLVPDS